jgi:hypothetical protein
MTPGRFCLFMPCCDQSHTSLDEAGKVVTGIADWSLAYLIAQVPGNGLPRQDGVRCGRSALRGF